MLEANGLSGFMAGCLILVGIVRVYFIRVVGRVRISIVIIGMVLIGWLFVIILSRRHIRYIITISLISIISLELIRIYYFYFIGIFYL